MKEFVLKAIERELATIRRRGKKQFAVTLPLVRSKKPGSLRTMTNAEIEDLLG